MTARTPSDPPLPDVTSVIAPEKVMRAIDWDKIAEQRGLSPEELEAAKKVFAERADVLRRLS